MNLFKPPIKKRIEQKDFEGLQQILASNPSLANAGITIPFDILCTAKAHPLHRICDAVFSAKITEEESVKLAEVLLANGADIDGDKMKGEGTPLLAAASLRAQQVGILYIEKGADIHHTFKNDGASALHWAAYCGQNQLVDRLIKANASIDTPDNTYDSTPLGWAIQSLQTNNQRKEDQHIACIESLLKSGASLKKLSKEKADYLHLLAKKDMKLQELLG